MSMLGLWENIGFITCFLLVSCQSGKAIIVAEPTEMITTASESILPTTLPFSGTVTTLPEEWLGMLRIEPDFNYGISQMSPNGQWIMTNRTNDAENIRVMDFQRVADIDSSFQYKEDESLGYITWQSWSPDSTSIVALSADLPGRCPYRRIIIFKLNAARQELIPKYLLPFLKRTK